MLRGPLGLLALVYGRKKKGSKAGMLLVLLLVGASVGMTLAACGGGQQLPPGPVTATIVHTPGSATATATATFGDGTTVTANIPSPTLTPSPSQTPSITCTSTITPTPTQPTQESIKAELLLYGVAATGNWPSVIELGYVLNAVKKVAERFASELLMSPTEAFKAIYGHQYTIKYGCGPCTAFGLTTPQDLIMFKSFYKYEKRQDFPMINIRLVIHELGHAFEWKACEAVNGEAACKNPNYDYHSLPIRKRLRDKWVEKTYLQRESYGTGNPISGEPRFSGFAGDAEVWQFAVQDIDSAGEVWADMFLGWVYENLASGRMGYMNEVMPDYLHQISGR